MKKLKVILLFFLLLFCINTNVKASEYRDVSKSELCYDINAFEVIDDYIMINGWAVGNDNQQLTGDDTHQYSLEVTNTLTGEIYEYYATLQDVDKTEFYQDYSATRQADYWEVNADTSEVYYLYTKIGFEFKIPLSDLVDECEYTLKIRLYAKLVNDKTQTDIYAFNISNSYTISGYTYSLKSDLLNSGVMTSADYLYVREGPSTSYSIKESAYWGSSGAYKMYWYPYMNYTNVLGAVQNDPGNISSETWINIGMYDGGVYNNRARAYTGTTDSGWAPWIYLEGTGTPAVINVTRNKNTSINSITTYTALQNTSTSIDVNLTNNISQELNIKIYHNNELVYNQNQNFLGTTTINTNYTITSSGTIKVVVTEANGLESEMYSNIYISENSTITISESTQSIQPSTPIVVYTDSNGTTNYYEKIIATVPHKNITIINGQSFENWLKIDYSSDFYTINNTITAEILYPNQENALTYNMIDELVLVDLNKDNITSTSNTFYLDYYKMNKKDGTIYFSDTEVENTIDAGNEWYPNILEPLGTYDYTYKAYNIGINNIDIIIDCTYTTVTELLGTNGEFNIKRVYIPSNSLELYSQTFTLNELKEKVGV